MYTFKHVPRGIQYTTPACCCVWGGSRKQVRIPNGASVLLMVTDRWRMYGRVIVAVGVSRSGCMYSFYVYITLKMFQWLGLAHGQPKGLKDGICG